jgi:DNA adenine methylase
MPNLPHPIPYQGSKRGLAPIISLYIPHEIDCWYEPFAGSAAMSIWIARYRGPKRIILGDSLGPITELWRAILADHRKVARRYNEIWSLQIPGDLNYFNRVRERFNRERDPVDLLYLLCRCVKNAVRFNAKGNFTQSVDKRRLGMRPQKMAKALSEAAALLKGKAEVRAGDWLDTTADATPTDFLYMDPPYLGTSVGRDRRYAEWMSQERLVEGLRELRRRDLRFALSYDGKSGDRIYGPPLPRELGLTHLMIHAGRSTQATLNGAKDETYESLYLSHGIAADSVHRPQSRPRELTQLELSAA